MEWLDGAEAPAPGARFAGYNHHRMIDEWRKVSHIAELEEQRASAGRSLIRTAATVTRSWTPRSPCHMALRIRARRDRHEAETVCLVGTGPFRGRSGHGAQTGAGQGDRGLPAGGASHEQWEQPCTASGRLPKQPASQICRDRRRSEPVGPRQPCSQVGLRMSPYYQEGGRFVGRSAQLQGARVRSPRPPGARRTCARQPTGRTASATAAPTVVLAAGLRLFCEPVPNYRRLSGLQVAW